MNALVIGGNGFIGSHLVDELLRLGHHVSVLDIRDELFRKRLENVTYFYGNINNRSELRQSLNGVDIVFHLASSMTPAMSNKNIGQDINENLVGTINLIEEAIDQNIRRMVYYSSGGTVYGNPQSTPISEEHPNDPISSYGITKLATEKFIMLYHYKGLIDPLILRPSNPYGPRQNYSGIQGVISRFLYLIKEKRPLEVWGDGSIVRDYIYINDLVKLCCRAAFSDVNGIFNAGNGNGNSINEIIEKIIEATGIKPQVTYKPARNVDVEKVILDIKKAETCFSWTPETDFKEGIARHWEWINSLKL